MTPLIEPAQAHQLEQHLNELRILLQERSIRKGEFVLASGRSSRYYCDTKATVLSPRGSKLVGEILYSILATREVQAVGGLAMGAVYLATAVSLVSADRRPIFAYTVRERQKGHGLKKMIEESYHPDGMPLLSEGRRVAVVDDVITTGGSVLKAVEAVQERNCALDIVLAIVDRNEGGREALQARGLPYRSLYSTDRDGTLTRNDISSLLGTHRDT